jgi:glycerate kinase
MTQRRLSVVVAPDSFGGALSSLAAAEAIRDGWARVRPDDEIALRPMADGGEGTLAAIRAALGEAVDEREVQTTDALGRPVTASYLLLDGGVSAFVELAAASGLAHLAPDERTPESVRRASTRGTGPVIRAALDSGARRITIGLGGSATNDGGTGLLAALGLRLLDRNGHDLPDGGGALASLDSIATDDLDPRLAASRVIVASDVTNPLCGPRGATATYGPQKGADPTTVEELDRALATLGRAIERATGRLVADLPGAGAAGGTTPGRMGFTGATIRPGVEIVAELVGLATALEDADVVITGEGRADEQTLQGKTAMGVATLARPRSTPVVLLCGALGSGAEAVEASGAFSLVQPIGDRPATLEAAMEDSARLLANAAARVARGIGIGLEIGPSA